MNSTSTDRVAIPTEGMFWHDGLLLAPLHFEQPMPADMRDVLASLRLR